MILLILFVIILSFFYFINKELFINYPQYDPSIWNNNKYIQASHNCYMYALNKIDKKLKKKCKLTFYKRENDNCMSLRPRPGIKSNYDVQGMNVFNCLDMKLAILKDNPDAYETNQNDNCKINYHKVALSLDEYVTYHFYRQDDNGFWSHKDGGRKATNLDEDDKLISDPKYANRGRYKLFCNYFCVPNKTS